MRLAKYALLCGLLLGTGCSEAKSLEFNYVDKNSGGGIVQRLEIHGNKLEYYSYNNGLPKKGVVEVSASAAREFADAANAIGDLKCRNLPSADSSEITIITGKVKIVCYEPSFDQNPKLFELVQKIRVYLSKV